MHTVVCIPRQQRDTRDSCPILPSRKDNAETLPTAPSFLATASTRNSFPLATPSGLLGVRRLLSPQAGWEGRVAPTLTASSSLKY
ncbi:hypothetical protein E2C01_101161 [Portunus trituberculatus]|uniref:Uncharacterized protein n=1 Tax=Portunus trituberculatus TaxID=210409 RepID=A0A5B7K8V4_PORTR|nr:hypothetical protein [Portunus trituberculatus]